jgi:osmotically-inducible protein OsmY
MHAQQQHPASFEKVPLKIHSGRLEPASLAEFRLRSSSYPQLRAVRCDFHEGILTLRGKVSSFYITQMAQALAARIPGVEEVVNRIEVKETA